MTRNTWELDEVTDNTDANSEQALGLGPKRLKDKIVNKHMAQYQENNPGMAQGQGGVQTFHLVLFTPNILKLERSEKKQVQH